jgi:hypothetical protein
MSPCPVTFGVPPLRRRLPVRSSFRHSRSRAAAEAVIPAAVIPQAVITGATIPAGGIPAEVPIAPASERAGSAALTRVPVGWMHTDRADLGSPAIMAAGPRRYTRAPAGRSPGGRVGMVPLVAMVHRVGMAIGIHRIGRS